MTHHSIPLYSDVWNVSRMSGCGIVLMHDSNADGLGPARKNIAYILIEQLIPILKQRGFDFVRLDEIPALAAMSRQPFEFTLQTANSVHEPPLYCRINGHKIYLSDQEADQDRWTAVNLGNGQVGLRSPSGKLFVLHRDGRKPSVSPLKSAIKRHLTLLAWAVS